MMKKQSKKTLQKIKKGIYIEKSYPPRVAVGAPDKPSTDARVDEKEILSFT